MPGYNSFARFYEGLMEDAEYKKRCDYILELSRRFCHDMGRTLDLACGTGSLTRELKKCGVDVFGVDSSADMLTEAMQKNFEDELDILYVNQEMQNLDLGQTVDACVCTLDSLNHITDIDVLQQVFCRIGEFMESGGLLIFDVNTVYKHREILADNAFVFENDEVFCAWQNELEENDVVNIYLDFFEKDGEVYHRYQENFTERAYSRECLDKLLKNAEFEVLAVYDDLSFEAPESTSQRLIYAAKKI